MARGLNQYMLGKKNNTFCHLLWERAFINEHGDVFFCCLCRPEPIGNIYEHTLAYVWKKSKKAKLFRGMALKGDLGCYASCTVLSKREKEMVLGRFYRNRGKFIEAESAFQDVLKITPKNYGIYFELGWLYNDQGGYAEAEASFKKALELEPGNSDAYVGLGWSCQEQKKYPEAEASFKKALELEPGNSDAYVGLGWLCKEKKDYSGAEASFKKALELEPGNSDAYVGLGWLCKEKKKYAEAREFFEKALKIHPGSNAACAELGWLYKEQGKFREAEVFFEKALELNPNSESACVGLGWLYKDQEKLSQATRLLRKALELNPRNEVAQTIFAQIYRKAPSGLKLGAKISAKERKDLPLRTADTILEDNNSDSDVYKQDKTDYPRTLHILIGTLCPLSCIMCRQNHRLNIALNNEMLKKNIDWPRIEDITIQGGEVLAIPSAKELLIWLTEKMKKKIKLVTNGLLINREWAERLVRGSEWIEVSVNAATKQMHEFVNRGSDFEKVIRNIKMLIDLKRSYNAKTDIRYHFTIVPENVHEIAQAIKFADRLGCDLIAYSFDSPRVEIFLSQHKKMKKKIKDEISKLSNKNLNIKVQRNQLHQLGLVGDSNHNLFVDDY